MTEVQFAKVFLGNLDGRPIKLQADYIEDPKSYPSRPPYTLPRMPKPMKKPAAALAPGQVPAVTVSIKSLHRTQPLDVTLSSPEYTFALATTSLLDVKTALSEKSHVPADKLRLLYNKKPVTDSKVLKDLVTGDETEVKLGVMVSGGAETVAAAEAAAAQSKSAAATPAATTPAATAEPTAVVAESEAFWNDLRGFLVKRTGSKTQADELFSLFLRSWEERMI
ncbi:hypothetical protein Sste5346_000271 [Sporothrix stenoceras]|uniref:Ubiquitin-like domain-containing protein n=1 Tax=Sporothrix stenoceras TaxID=5173 RepID=A0ABR3ZUA2_9PEZI